MSDSTFNDLASRMFGGSTPQASTPAPAAAPVTATPTSELADLARGLFTSMETHVDDLAAGLDDEPAHATPTVDVPESHWARAEDVDAWETEVNSGPLAASLPMARAFLQQHAAPDLMHMLNQSGYGSNPHVIKFIADLARKFNAGGAR